MKLSFVYDEAFCFAFNGGHQDGIRESRDDSSHDILAAAARRLRATSGPGEASAPALKSQPSPGDPCLLDGGVKCRLKRGVLMSRQTRVISQHKWKSGGSGTADKFRRSQTCICSQTESFPPVIQIRSPPAARMMEKSIGRLKTK